jgi:hypothetical protein
MPVRFIRSSWVWKLLQHSALVFPKKGLSYFLLLNVLAGNVLVGLAYHGLYSRSYLDVSFLCCRVLIICDLAVYELIVGYLKINYFVSNSLPTGCLLAFLPCLPLTELIYVPPRTKRGKRKICFAKCDLQLATCFIYFRFLYTVTLE